MLVVCDSSIPPLFFFGGALLFHSLAPSSLSLSLSLSLRLRGWLLTHLFPPFLIPDDVTNTREAHVSHNPSGGEEGGVGGGGGVEKCWAAKFRHPSPRSTKHALRYVHDDTYLCLFIFFRRFFNTLVNSIVSLAAPLLPSSSSSSTSHHPPSSSVFAISFVFTDNEVLPPVCAAVFTASPHHTKPEDGFAAAAPNPKLANLASSKAVVSGIA